MGCAGIPFLLSWNRVAGAGVGTPAPPAPGVSQVAELCHGCGGMPIVLGIAAASIRDKFGWRKRWLDAAEDRSGNGGEVDGESTAPRLSLGSPGIQAGIIPPPSSSARRALRACRAGSLSRFHGLRRDPFSPELEPRRGSGRGNARSTCTGRLAGGRTLSRMRRDAGRTRIAAASIRDKFGWRKRWLDAAEDRSGNGGEVDGESTAPRLSLGSPGIQAGIIPPPSSSARRALRACRAGSLSRFHGLRRNPFSPELEPRRGSGRGNARSTCTGRLAGGRTLSRMRRDAGRTRIAAASIRDKFGWRKRWLDAAEDRSGNGGEVDGESTAPRLSLGSPGIQAGIIPPPSSSARRALRACRAGSLSRFHGLRRNPFSPELEPRRGSGRGNARSTCTGRLAGGRNGQSPPTMVQCSRHPPHSSSRRF